MTKKKANYSDYLQKYYEDKAIILTNDKKEREGILKTAKTYYNTLKIFVEYITKHSVELHKLDKYDIEKIFKVIQSTGYINKQGQKKVYSKSFMRLLKVVSKDFFEYLKREKVIKRNIANPFEGRFSLDLTVSSEEITKKVRDKYLTENEVKKLLTYIKSNNRKGKETRGRKRTGYKSLYEAVMLMLTLGLRISEVERLERKDFEVLSNGLIKLYVKPSKRNKDRVTYFVGSDAQKKEILGIIKNSDFSFNGNVIGTQINRIGKDLKISSLSAHSLRHTFGTISVSKGIPYEKISFLLGHSDITTTQIYAKITNNSIESALLSLNFLV